MTAATLFIDRDGTLIEEPPDKQVDAIEKVRFMPGVFTALTSLKRQGYRLVIVTNQNDLGTERFPKAAFQAAHDFMLETFKSQGIEFDAIFVCPHGKGEGCGCRKPKTGLLDAYILEQPFDEVRSAVIGDRKSDLELATNLKVRGLAISRYGSEDETWPGIVKTLCARVAHITRRTRETCIEVQVNLDASEPIRISTGIGFFDHMLEQLSNHGGFSLELTAKGDLHVDEHHTVEDTALALGDALHKALHDKQGITRYGFLLPMDEAQAKIALDLSGRPFAAFEGALLREKVGTFPTELVPHFFRSLSETLKAAIHISVKGVNTHHMVEACFKGVGRTLRQAIRIEGDTLPSTKGIL